MNENYHKLWSMVFRETAANRSVYDPEYRGLCVRAMTSTTPQQPVAVIAWIGRNRGPDPLFVDRDALAFFMGGRNLVLREVASRVQSDLDFAVTTGLDLGTPQTNSRKAQLVLADDIATLRAQAFTPTAAPVSGEIGLV